MHGNFFKVRNTWKEDPPACDSIYFGLGRGAITEIENVLLTLCFNKD